MNYGDQYFYSVHPACNEILIGTQVSALTPEGTGTFAANRFSVGKVSKVGKEGRLRE
jgi:hypothetical protein